MAAGGLGGCVAVGGVGSCVIGERAAVGCGVAEGVGCCVLGERAIQILWSILTIFGAENRAKMTILGADFM